MRFTILKPTIVGSLLLFSSIAAPVLMPAGSAASAADTGSAASAAISPATARPGSRAPAELSASSAATPRSALDGAGWLGRQFLKSGDLPVSEGEAGLNNLSLALTSLVAAESGRKQAAAGLTYLERNFESFVSDPVTKTKSVDLPGRLAEVILAAVATGANPASFGGHRAADDLVARLLATETKKGANAGLFGSPNSPTYSSAYTEGLAVLALAAVGQPNPAGAQWLVRQQCSNGGWTAYNAHPSKACPAEDPSTYAGADTNSTSLAVEALVATDVTPRISPLGFFEKAQYPDGGFGYIGAVAKSQPVDPDSTALVIQALVALGKLDDPAFDKSGGAKPERALDHFQLGCGAPVSERGAYRFPGVSGPNLIATIQAIPAAAEKAYPITKGTLSASLPRTSCPSSKTARTLSTTTSIEKTCSSVPKSTAGQVVVPIVVDFGSDASKIDVTCVSVSTGSTGSDVLAKRATILHTPQPVYNSAGLLCQIDGYPSSGCGTETRNHYAYWAYFHGGSTWTYANDGPAENVVSKGDVEGWRFEPDGSATSSDPAPRTASSASALETASTSKTPTTIPTTTTNASHAPTTTAPTSGGHTTSTIAHSGSTTPGSTTPGSTTPGSTTPGAGRSSSSKHNSSGKSNGSAHGTVLAAGDLAGHPLARASNAGRDVLLGLAGLVILGGAGFALLASRRRAGAGG